MSAVLDSPAVRSWLAGAVDALRAGRERLDARNVFPVHDRDTGTNMYLTALAGLEATGACPPHAPPASVLAAAADGARLGARGNSGSILGEFLGAMADHLAPTDSPAPADILTPPEPPLPADSTAVVGPRDIARALTAADRSVRAALARPVEGTVVTVAREVARRAEALAAGPVELPGMLPDLATTAHRALDRTTWQLESLRRAGVVDAGAAGLVIVLDALVETLLGVPAPPLDDWLPPVDVPPRSGVSAGGRPTGSEEGRGAPDRHGWEDAPRDRPGREDAPRDRHRREETPRDRHGSQEAVGDPSGEPEEGWFEVMYRVRLDSAEAGGRLRQGLAAVGSSVVVTGGPSTWQVHVHTDDVPGVLAVGPGRSRSRAVVRTMRPRAPMPTPPTVLAVTTAPLLAADLADAGAVVLLDGPGFEVDASDVAHALGEVAGPDTAGEARGRHTAGQAAAPHVLVAAGPGGRQAVEAHLDRLRVGNDGPLAPAGTVPVAVLLEDDLSLLTAVLTLDEPGPAGTCADRMRAACAAMRTVRLERRRAVGEVQDVLQAADRLLATTHPRPEGGNPEPDGRLVAPEPDGGSALRESGADPVLPDSGADPAVPELGSDPARPGPGADPLLPGPGADPLLPGPDLGLLTVLLGARGAGPGDPDALARSLRRAHPDLEVQVILGGQAGPDVVLGLQ